MMEMSTFLLLLNSIISILHPVKHIPQIIHTINTKRVEDISKINIICELGMNIMSVTSCLLIYFYMGKKMFFLPIIIEKLSSTVFIGTIYYLKIKYTLTPYSYEEITPINSPTILHKNTEKDIQYESFNI
jgi:uncharacterized protein with PQ loop repeat